MTTFVDTSALYSLLDEDDLNHAAAREWLTGPGRDAGEILVSHNYVVVETAALVRRRLGSDATRVLFQGLLPAVSIFYVDEHLHRLAVASYLAASRLRPSLVDWVSFEMMRNSRVERAFAFDRDFSNEGFSTVP